MQIIRNSNLNIQNELASVSQGRLTLTSNTPVLSSNVTNATTLYYTPYTGSQISIWDGSKWVLKTFTELSLSLSGLPANTNYDVFIYDNNGTLTLEAVAWSNSGAGTSARASALSFLNGVRVKDSDKRKYLGSFRTTGTIGQTAFINNTLPSSLFIKNEFNRIPITLYMSEGAETHTYNVVATRNYNNSANYRFNVLCIDNENLEFSFNNSSGGYLLVSANVSGTDWNNIFWGTMCTIAGEYVRSSALFSTSFDGFQYFQITEKAFNPSFTGISIQLSAYLRTHY